MRRDVAQRGPPRVGSRWGHEARAERCRPLQEATLGLRRWSATAPQAGAWRWVPDARVIRTRRRRQRRQRAIRVCALTLAPLLAQHGLPRCF